MTDAQSESSYIREITDYYCSLAGKAGIISSEDAQVLINWKREGIPKQDVLLGIKKAFQSGYKPAMMRISGCSRFVEERFHQSRLSAGFSKTGSRKRPGEINIHSIIGAVSLKLSKAASETEDANTKNCLKKAVKILADSGKGDDIYGFLQAFRRQLCDELIAAFGSVRASCIENRAREIVPPGGSFINEEERSKAFTACMDDLIMKEVGLEDMFSLSDESEDDENM